MFHFFKKKEPIVINDTYGVFALHKDRKCYEGTTVWLGKEMFVTLFCDSRETLTAEKALENFHKLMENAADWDKRIREQSARDMAGGGEMIEIWDEDENEEPLTVSKEEFTRRMSIGFVYLYPDGSIFFYYDLDNMFTDHGLGINADISGELESPDLVG